jgi:transcriptional regulator with XRE-family HTH domain
MVLHRLIETTAETGQVESLPKPLVRQCDLPGVRSCRTGPAEKCVVASDLPQWNNPGMIIGDRLRELREAKKLSQGDIEKRTGLIRCYVSRVENGHTIPAIETIEKFARALEVPMYQLFYDGEELPKLPNLSKRKSSGEVAWGSSGKDARYLSKLRRLLGKADEEDRKLVLFMAQKMARR